MVQCGIDAWEFPAGGKLFLPLNSWYLAGQKSFAKRFWMISCDDKCMLWMQSGSNWIQAFVKRLYIIFIAHCTISKTPSCQIWISPPWRLPPPLFDQYFDRLLTQLIQPGLIRSWSIYWNVLDHDIGQEIILRSKLSSPQNRRWECCEWKEYSYHQAHFSSSNHPSTFPSHFFDS